MTENQIATEIVDAAYLKIADKRLGLLIEDGITRIANGLPEM